MKKIISILLIVLIVFTMIPRNVEAASGLVEIYWNTSTNKGGSGVGPGGSLSIRNSLNGIGYNSKRYQDTHAYYVRRTMNDDKVFAIISHGAPGRIVCDGNTTVSGKAVSSDSKNYSLAAYFGSGSLSSLKFAYYGGCQTARTDSTYGNLLTYTTTTLGAKSALGFYNSVWDAQATYFEGLLFSYLAEGATVQSAAAISASKTYAKYGSYGEVNTYQIKGTGTTKIN